MICYPNPLIRFLLAGIVLCAGAAASAAPPVPANSVAFGPRAGVSISQGDIYNQINNAVNIGNGAVNIGNAAYSLGSTAYNTATQAYNLGSIAYQSAENANARAGAAEAAANSGGVVTKYGEEYFNNGRDRTTYMCIRGRQEDKQVNGWPQSTWRCPAGSGDVVLSWSSDTP